MPYGTLTHPNFDTKRDKGLVPVVTALRAVLVLLVV